MPDKTGRLTPKERAFAMHYAGTGDMIYSASKAGYAHANQRALEKLKSPAIMREIEARTRERVLMMSEKCLVRLDQAIDNPKTTTKDIIGIGRLLLQHRQTVSAGGQDDEHEMPMDELIKKLETRMSDLRVIAGETVDVFS